MTVLSETRLFGSAGVPLRVWDQTALDPRRARSLLLVLAALLGGAAVCVTASARLATRSTATEATA